jgi:phosphoadenosine phosphosulfate reductase
VLFLDTGYHFAETIGTRDAVGAGLRRERPHDAAAADRSRSRTSSTAPGCTSGIPTPAARCARSSRSRAGLADYTAWASGIRRDEAATRRDIGVVEWDASARW